MKIVKGVAVFLVLCLAAYGAFALLKRPPQVNIADGDKGHLQDLGIHVHDTQAADTGLSPILGDVQGVAPISAGIGSPFGGAGSSTPPSFLTEPTTSSVPPAFMMGVTETAPRVATATVEPLLTPEVSEVVDDLLPPTTFSDPVEFIFEPIPIEISPIETPPIEIPPIDAASFDAPPLAMLPFPSEVFPISATESPPPWSSEGWDGPAMNIPATSPASETLLTLNSPPNPIAPNPIAPFFANVQPPVHEQITSQITSQNTPQITLLPTDTSIQKATENIRKIESDVTTTQVPIPVPALTSILVPTSVLVPEAHKNHGHAFSSLDSIPIEVASTSNTRYTQTASRQPLVFETVRPEVSPTAPMVVFATPSQANQLQQLEPQHPEQIQEPVAVVPATVVSVPINQEVRPIGTPRLIDNATPPTSPPVARTSVQPTIRETIERFVQTQRRLAESGDPENIRQAFIQLSQLYELDELGDAERAMMQPLLDVLALRVIYARETHILEPSYRVKPGEAIESIAADFNLTPSLLRKINGLGPSQDLPVGATIKVVFGQFDARISMRQKELTLLLGGLYAGRFSFAMPNEDVPVRKGDFYVTNRGDRMVVLNNGWVLATDLSRNATMVFADRDAREIFDILSEQSVIVVE